MNVVTMTVNEVVSSIFDADRFRYRNLELGEAIEAIMQKHPDAPWQDPVALHKAVIRWRLEFDRREARVTAAPQKVKKNKRTKTNIAGRLLNA